MAPVPFDQEVKYLPTLLVISHIITVVYLTSVVGLGLYRSWKSLSPSQDTRDRLAHRKKLVPVFASLAVLAFLLAGYSSLQYATLSYQVWADERGIEVPTSIFGGFPNSGDDSRLYLTQWLSDTPIYQDAVEIIAEKARRFWWGQQIDLAMISWSLLLAIEGRRKRIPFVWAYLALAQLVSLSFAQNLFYVALLLTPSPIPDVDIFLSSRVARFRDAVFPPKPSNWCPNPALFLGVLALNYLSLFFLPYAAGTLSFKSILLSSRALTFGLLVMPSVIPESWGTVHPHPHKAYSAFNTLFQAAATASIVLHGKATFVGLVFNTPDSHYHRHSIRIPFDTAKRSTWERSTTAVGRVLGSTADHPVVAVVGRDVILCALSLGIWAAVRALDSQDILKSAIPFYSVTESGLVDDIASLASSESAVIKAKQDDESLTRSKGRGRKARAASSNDTNDETPTATGSKRRTGRARKVKPDPEEVPDDDTYEPTAAESVNATAGDVLPSEDIDWESAALAWGLTAVGGLGCSSAGVYGGECISR